MKKIFILLIVLASLITSALLISQELQAQTEVSDLKKYSTFLSNFTELGFMNFDLKENGPDDMLHLGNMAHPENSNPDLIRFGVEHNYKNNFKSRVVASKIEDDPNGALTIDGKLVQESVLKYFDLKLVNQTVDQSDPPYYYDGKLYHFHGADGEANYQANVKKVRQEGDIIFLTGTIYDAEAMFNDDGTDPDKYAEGTFEASAKPNKFQGKDGWSILSFKTQWEE
jgi:hypothetical protein